MQPPLVKVGLLPCPAYEKEHLYQTLKKIIELLGGIDKFIKPEQKVFVKVNHLPPPSPAERAIVTHPVFIEQVVTILLEAGAKVRVGDDINLSQGDGFAVSGLRQVCQRLGVKLVNLREEGFRKVRISNGKVLTQTYLAKAIYEAEVIVNLPNFKTHSLTCFTGAVKNMYGCLPEGLRSRYHREFLGERFHSLLVDLYSALKPQLHIMDAVVGMEGEGPANGRPRNIGLIMASADGVALDRVALSLAGIDINEALYLKEAEERGVGKYIPDDQDRTNPKRFPAGIQVVGEKLSSVKIPDFVPSSSFHYINKWVPDFLFQLISGLFNSRPRVNPSKCCLCLACQRVCPTGSILVGEKSVSIKKRTCISCMCCHEACRYNAIQVKRGIITRSLIAILKKIRGFISSLIMSIL